MPADQFVNAMGGLLAMAHLTPEDPKGVLFGAGHTVNATPREILAKAAAWFARETNSIPSGSSNS